MQLQQRGSRTLYKGGSLVELVHIMRNHALEPCPSVDAYMQAYSERMQKWDGSKIRTTSATEFLQDLQRCGEVRIWEDWRPYRPD